MPYGLTTYGGQGNDGIIYEYDYLNDLFVKVYDFSELSTGKSPFGHLTIASNGKLYGLNRAGGALNHGIFYSFEPERKILALKEEFSGSNGAVPFSYLTEFYGHVGIQKVKESGMNFTA